MELTGIISRHGRRHSCSGALSISVVKELGRGWNISSTWIVTRSNGTPAVLNKTRKEVSISGMKLEIWA
jgi:hypothetical protein